MIPVDILDSILKMKNRFSRTKKTKYHLIADTWKDPADITLSR